MLAGGLGPLAAAALAPSVRVWQSPYRPVPHPAVMAFSISVYFSAAFIIFHFFAL
jgi:hypothetical protein